MAHILLNISNNHALQQFLHDCVDDLVGISSINFDKTSDIKWTKQDCQAATAFVQNLYREIANTDDGLLNLVSIESLNERIRQFILDYYEIRKDEISNSIIKKSLVEGGKLVVQDIDWKLKWIMGSSKLATLREPLLQFDFHCLQMEDDRYRTVNFEVNLQQVDQLISTLEQLKNELKESKQSV